MISIEKDFALNVSVFMRLSSRIYKIMFSCTATDIYKDDPDLSPFCN